MIHTRRLSLGSPPVIFLLVKLALSVYSDLLFNMPYPGRLTKDRSLLLIGWKAENFKRSRYWQICLLGSIFGPQMVPLGFTSQKKKAVAPGLSCKGRKSHLGRLTLSIA